jgi:hypothetical protein
MLEVTLPMGSPTPYAGETITIARMPTNILRSAMNELLSNACNSLENSRDIPEVKVAEANLMSTLGAEICPTVY